MIKFDNIRIIELVIIDNWTHLSNRDDRSSNVKIFDFSPPTESLFMTLQTAPGVYRSWCFASVVVGDGVNKASNGVWLKTDESESSKETPSRKKKEKGKKYKSSTLKKLESELKDDESAITVRSS